MINKNLSERIQRNPTSYRIDSIINPFILSSLSLPVSRALSRRDSRTQPRVSNPGKTQNNTQQPRKGGRFEIARGVNVIFVERYVRGLILSCALSGRVAFWPTVPDGGTTLTLLGIGLVSLTALRRRFAL